MKHDVHEHSAYLANGTGSAPSGAAAGTIYTCPMHPEIRQPGPGNCPICGMSLEPVMPALEEDGNPELADFRRRFWWTLPLTVAGVLIAMFSHSMPLIDPRTQSWASSP